jgi:ribokinase
LKKEGIMAKILVVGSINMDLVVRVPQIPKPGETVIGGDFETFPGGKGANQAVAASRMGGEVTMVGRVGNDDFGNSLIQGLIEDCVRTTYVIKDSEASTGIAMIAVDPSGQNIIMVASGANAKVSAEDVNNARELMREADLLLVQLECPLETVSRAIDLAKAYEVDVVLNPAPAQPLSEGLLSKVDYLTPNETELALLSGEPDVERSIEILRGWGVRNLIITLGANGARVVNEGLDQYFPSFEITAIDATAAGDAFNGALAVGLAEGKPLSEAVRYGTAAGALAATRRGAQPSLPQREDVEKLIGSISM